MKQNIVVIDIETSGLKPEKHGILSIGAIDYNSSRIFYQECKLNHNKKYNEEALVINGFDKTHFIQNQLGVLPNAQGQEVAPERTDGGCTPIVPDDSPCLPNDQNRL